MLGLSYRANVGPEAPDAEFLTCVQCDGEAFDLDEESRCERCVKGATRTEREAQLEAEFYEQFSMEEM